MSDQATVGNHIHERQHGIPAVHHGSVSDHHDVEQHHGNAKEVHDSVIDSGQHDPSREHTFVRGRVKDDHNLLAHGCATHD